MIGKIIEKIKYELRFDNANYYVRISEKIAKNTYNKRLRKKIDSLAPIELIGANAKLTLAMLANKLNFYESVAALYSFCYWKRDIQIHYHEDGTLTEKEISYLENMFRGIEIFRRSEQDVEVRDYLISKKLDDCAELRGHFVFAIRSFDMIIHKKTPYLLQIDSDVLFFSKPHEILDIVDKGNYNGCYNLDVSNAYTFSPETMGKYVPVPVVNRFNAGVFMHNFNEDFFSFFQDILKKQPEAITSWHLEQTVFAMYASLKGDFLALPKYYDLARKERSLGTKLVSEHYVHHTGSDFHKDFLYKISPLFIKN